jgi:hypothetical protein
MRRVLEKYCGELIGVNVDDAFNYQPILLNEVTAKRFELLTERHVLYFQFRWILRVAEGQFYLGKGRNAVEVPLLVQVFQPVVVERGGGGGAFGVGAVFSE